MPAPAPAPSSSAGPSRPPAPPPKRTAFAPLPASAIQPFYTGSGPTALSKDGRFLFTSLEEDVVCTDLGGGTGGERGWGVGSRVGGFEVDGEEISSLALTPSASHLCVTTRAAACTLYIYAIVSLGGGGHAPPSPLSSLGGESPGGLQVKRLRSQARAHDAPVALSAVDSTGTLLATGSADGVLKLWDIAGGFVTHILRGHGGVVSAVAFDIDVEAGRSRLATSSVDGRVRVWDLNDRPKQGAQKPVAVLAGHVSVVRGLSVNSRGDRMVSAARDKTICLWEAAAASGKKKQNKGGASSPEWTLRDTLSAGEGVEACAFLDDDRFYTGGTSSELRIWSFDAGSVSALQPRGRWARAAHGRGNTADDDGDEDDEDEALRGIVAVHSVAAANSGAATSALVSLHADSRLVFRTVAAGDDDDDAARPPLLTRTRQIVGFNDEAVDLAFLAPAAGSSRGRIAVATNSSAIRVYPLPQLGDDSGSDEAGGDGDGDGSSPPASVDLLPSESSEPGHGDIVLCIDSSPAGDLLASGSKDRTARVWAYSAALREWRCVAVAEGHAESVGAIAFSKKSARADGQSANFLVTASQDRTVKVWDLSPLQAGIDEGDGAKSSAAPLRLRSLLTLKVHEKAVNALAVAPNDSLLATGSQDRTAKLFTLSFLPPSKSNAHTASARLTPLATLKGHKRGVWSVAFSPFDAALLTASGDRTARLWSLKDHTCVKTYEGHAHSVLCARFLAGSRGTQILTAGADGLIKVWNVRDEECCATLEVAPEGDRVWAAGAFLGAAAAVKAADASPTAGGAAPPPPPPLGLVTASADGHIRFFADVTRARADEALQERERAVQREQEYDNLVAVEDYTRAVLLCLAEDQPRRLLGLLQVVAARRPASGSGGAAGVEDGAMALLDAALADGATATATAGAGAGAAPSDERTRAADASSITGLCAVDATLARLPPALLVRLLTYARTWNATARSAPVAQGVLHCVLRSYTLPAIVAAFSGEGGARAHALGGNGGRGGAAGEDKALRQGKPRAPALSLPALLAALLPYTERHYARAERMLVESSILEYTVRVMGGGVTAEAEAEGGGGGMDEGMDLDVDAGEGEESGDEEMRGSEEEEEGEGELRSEDEGGY